MKFSGGNTSGNCLKIRHVADFPRLPNVWIALSALSGQTRTPEILARNPMGQIPVIELDDGRHLAQSNAIMRYLARSSTLLPEDPWIQAKIDEWLNWGQYSHEPHIAVCRFHMLYLKRQKEAREGWRAERGENALDLMEHHLAGHSKVLGPPQPFFVDGALTIADVALLAYTRVAHEGGFDLASRPHIRSWIARCEDTLGITM